MAASGTGYCDPGEAHIESPSVDTRIVLFTVSDGVLQLNLRQSDDGRAAATSRLSVDRRQPHGSAARALADETGVRERYLEQLYTISDVAARDWILTIAYLGLALTGSSGPPPTTAQWFPIESLPGLGVLDSRIVEYGLLRLRAKLGYTTIAFHLLPPAFALGDLQQVYEAVLGRGLDKRNFRRSIHAAGVLEATGERRRDGSHRPAQLYRFRATHDAETYLTPAWAARRTSEESLA